MNCWAVSVVAFFWRHERWFVALLILVVILLLVGPIIVNGLVNGEWT